MALTGIVERRGTRPRECNPSLPAPEARPGISRTATWLALGTVPVALAWLGLRRAWGIRKVKNLMVDDVVTVGSTATIREAAELMRDSNVGVLPVVENGRLVGVVTDRDLVVRALAGGTDLSMRVGDCASRDLVCARPEWDAEQAMRVMAACQVGRLPVVDDTRRVVGMITLSSLALRSRHGDEALHAAQQVSLRSTRVA